VLIVELVLVVVLVVLVVVAEDGNTLADLLVWPKAALKMLR
jgi:hypothetical protein